MVLKHCPLCKGVGTIVPTHKQVELFDNSKVVDPNEQAKCYYCKGTGYIDE